MIENLAPKAWFIKVKTTESPPSLFDFAVGKATVQEAIAAILHRPELELGDKVTSTSELSTTEISSCRIRPDEVRTYGPRVYKAGRWVIDRTVASH